MSTSAPRPGQRVRSASIAFRDILSDDGTHVRAWTNDPDGEIDGPTVVLCNGLGTNPYLWPWLLEPDCGVRVVSWNHRGVGGSERPADPKHVEIEHFVQDGLSVMDHFGIDSAVLMGWSMGVNTAFEMTYRHPERVRGIFAMCGVPGDTFATMLGPLHLPRLVARAVTVNACRVAQYAGRAVNPLVRHLPINASTVRLLGRTGFMFPVADPEAAAIGLQEFATTPVDWYAHLAISTSKHPRVRLSQITVPTMFVSATWDILAGARDMASASRRLSETGKDSTYVELRGSHFVQLEQPERVHGLLLEFLEQLS
ncbi:MULTISPECIES: alpha/beta fold hydrolase [unclassified Nocardioides]|uniref:alpha/beta fold hydrolase n=1 Tax=unclassified Nocardioides TaxID=2615069 RepID=UPI001153F307|nr:MULTISPECIES: alpha/beta hydrolase [unclassified Nocardioides]TQK72206.1 pimeloyl-ACP methyl ester carboxylesterase [Nocardioides sp. SLBN-35]WGY03581.1 alpha/beta hydrolase [Nocardioides sp. QY071]